MSEHQTETAFLRHLILYDDSEVRRKLEKSIAQVKHDTKCVQRAASVAAHLTLLALAGIAYGALLQESFPYNGSELVFRVLCGLGLASLICLAGFAGLLTVYLQKLHRLQKEARQFVIRLLESRLGNPHVAKVPGSHRVFDDGDAFQGATEVSGDAGSAILI
jgi:hypothetical protein